jgi:hypothetical protein
MKLLIMQFSPTSWHFIPLRSKYSPLILIKERDKDMWEDREVDGKINFLRTLNIKLDLRHQIHQLRGICKNVKTSYEVGTI